MICVMQLKSYKLPKGEDGNVLPKAKWIDVLKKIKCTSGKAMSLFYQALKPFKFNPISICKMIIDFWRALKVTHEGTNQMKKRK